MANTSPAPFNAAFRIAARPTPPAVNRAGRRAAGGLLRWQVARLVLAAGVAVAVVAGLGGGARAAGVPGQSGVGSPVFYLVSCEGGSFCLATGIYHKPGGGHPYTAELDAWDGRTWRTFPKPRYYNSDDYYNITCGGP